MMYLCNLVSNLSHINPVERAAFADKLKKRFNGDRFKAYYHEVNDGSVRLYVVDLHNADLLLRSPGTGKSGQDEYYMDVAVDMVYSGVKLYTCIVGEVTRVLNTLYKDWGEYQMLPDRICVDTVLGPYDRSHRFKYEVIF